MMAYAAKDPLYLATLAIANQDLPGVVEFCWRCHAPRGWLEDRSKPADGSQLNEEDRYGVSCDICHKLMDPLGDEAKKLIEHIPPGYGNAMMVADPENKVRGPYGDGTGAMPHKKIKSEYHATGELCGTCHDISNPVYAKDVNSQPPYAFGHLERTYSEWALSDFAKQGKEGSCQSCHYKTVEGGGQASRFSSPHRDYFVEHGPIGGSTWIQKTIPLAWPNEEFDQKALEASSKKALELLKTSAKLEFVGTDGSTLRITNLTGHKLPTGYPEARRMWINIKYFDGSGKLIDEVGKFGQRSDTVFGEEVEITDLLDADDTKVYEIIPGLSAEAAKTFGKEAGPSFHFALNDKIFKDNRIPPKGFDNAAFEERLCQPIAAQYADGQNWDDTALDIPETCAKVSVSLIYQSTTFEYIKFLAENNKTDDWGRKIYEIWQKTGQCPPVTIAQIEKVLAK
jgi:hypothetical protein